MISSNKYIEEYRNLLFEAIVKQYVTIDKQLIFNRIQKLFPDKNFYFYQLRSDSEEMK